MKKTIFFVLTVAVISFLVVCFFGKKNRMVNFINAKLLSRDLSGKGNSKSDFLDIFHTSMTLYGRVEDQDGKPIPNASVNLYPLDHPDYRKTSGKITIVSDEDGKFFVTGLKGASLGVSVFKEGYIHLSPLSHPSSSYTVGYARGSESGRRYSNPKTPLIMRLQNPGRMEPLIYVWKRWKLPIDGTPLKIALDSEEGKGQHQIEFKLWSRMADTRKPGAHVSDPFDWTFEAKIPGGGFLWCDNQDLAPVAPESGYKESIRYHLPNSLPREQWRRFRQARYFVRFPDNTYGQIDIDIDALMDNSPLYLRSWFNPKSGSRNLASLKRTNANSYGPDPEKQQ